MAKRKRKKNYWKYVWIVLVFILKLPYYFFRFFWRLGKGVSRRSEEVGVERKRKLIGAKFEEFRVLKTVDGDFKDWISSVAKSDSQIGIILGARGSGKTAFGVRFLENFYARYKKKCFAIGFLKADLPSWIKVISEVGEIENDSLVLIDEGGILFSSRRAMSGANKMLSDLIMIARHKNISILFVSQNSSNLEVNVLRQADFLVLKKSSLLQKDFERKIVRKIYDEAELSQEGDGRWGGGGTYIYSGKFRGFVSNSLPSFWRSGISKSFS